LRNIPSNEKLFHHLPDLVCACATGTITSAGVSNQPELPPEISFNKCAGRGDLLFVTLRLKAGEELRFVLDTGAPSTLFDRSLEPRLGRRLGRKRIWWSGRITALSRYAAPKLSLGDTPLLTGNLVATFDFKQLGYPGPPIMGVLGMDCLRHYCIQIDLNSRIIRFLHRDHLLDGNAGKSFPLVGYSPLSSHRGCFSVVEDFHHLKRA
jgi:hypothetical protein